MAARLATVLLVVLASALTAQNTPTNQVVIAVVDQTGAVIPGAHIGIVQLPEVIASEGERLRYASTTPEQATADTGPDGRATVDLGKGSYVVTISARGFQRYSEKIKVAGEASQNLRATLVVGYAYSGPVVDTRPVIPTEPTSLTASIPLESLQTTTLKASRIRRRW